MVVKVYEIILFYWVRAQRNLFATTVLIYPFFERHIAK